VLRFCTTSNACRPAAWTESRVRHERESEQLNRLLGSDASSGRYASMFWCYYDPASSVLHYVNAGHFPPILVAPGDRPADLTLLDTGGPVFGVLADARYAQGRRELRAGDTLILYSDGRHGEVGPPSAVTPEVKANDGRHIDDPGHSLVRRALFQDRARGGEGRGLHEGRPAAHERGPLHDVVLVTLANGGSSGSLPPRPLSEAEQEGLTSASGGVC
jgi:hypothetical protein